MAKTNTEVAVKEQGALAVYDYGEDANGAGFEGTSKEDYSVPFLGVLQGISPQIETLDGAKPGMLINTVTNDLYKGDAGIAFIPCLTQHCYVEWVPRTKGGGFVAVHELNSEVVAQAKADGGFGRIALPNENELIETFYVYGILVKDDGSVEQSVIAFTSTKIKKYKAWLTKARAIQISVPGGRRITPPLFAHVYRVKTVKEKNNQGEFYNFAVEFNGADAAACRLAPSDELYQAAKGFKEMVEAGTAKADHASQGTAGEPTDGGGADGKVPF